MYTPLTGEVIAHLMLCCCVYTRVTLGGEGDPEAVSELDFHCLSQTREHHWQRLMWRFQGEGHQRGEVEQEAQPFVLSETLPVVPAKLVKKVVTGDFVDMAELLKDNIEVERRQGASKLTLVTLHGCSPCKLMLATPHGC